MQDAMNAPGEPGTDPKPERPAAPPFAERLRPLLARRNEHRILALMLFMLHAAIWWDFGGALSRSVMLAHLGLFLLWQPLWSREQRLAWGSTFIFFVVALAIVAWLDWWLVTFWLLLLIGLIGGRVTFSRTDRYAYLVALVFLVSELLLVAVPRLFSVGGGFGQVQTLFGQGLLILPFGLLFFAAQDVEQRKVGTVDFLYGLTMALLSTVLALGSLLSMYATGVEYTVALFQTVLGIALFLLAISWLWLPMAGFSGLGQLWERYLLNIGTPFEQWLARLAQLAKQRQTPAQFLDSAMRQFVDLPWVSGVTWRAGDQEGEEGERTSHRFGVRTGDIHLTVHAHRPVGASLLLHGKLLAQLLGHFHSAKERERELAQRAHLQAIYETGARVTHDIKNLLQSLYTLSLAFQRSDKGERDDLEEMLERQLPHLTQRLQLALDKLQAPQEPVTLECQLGQWWEGLRERNKGQDIGFEATLEADLLIPMDLFDSVAENLLDNARFKRQMEPDLEIRVRLESTSERTRLCVSDNGSEVDPATAAVLFKEPVKSRSGLGIGLYQAAKQAKQLGYRLSLQQLPPGGVCFELLRNGRAK